MTTQRGDVSKETQHNIREAYALLSEYEIVDADYLDQQIVEEDSNVLKKSSLDPRVITVPLESVPVIDGVDEDDIAEGYLALYLIFLFNFIF